MQWFVILKRSVFGAAIPAMIAGCTVGPNYVRPNVNVPESFSQRGVASTQAVQWWQNFNDPQLTSLVERASKNNLDLRLASARLREARAQYGVVGAGAYPTADVKGSYTRNRSSQSAFSFGGGAASGSGTGTGGGAAISPGVETDLFQAGFDASWEVDVFGGVRRSIEAANDDIQASIEDRGDTLVTLTAEVARNYILYRGYQRQRVIAMENIDAQRGTLGITEQKLKAGIGVTELDVVRQKALVASTEAQIPTLETGMRQAAHALATLLGQNPLTLDAELEQNQPIPTGAPQIPVGLPSELLRRRPDIRRAERQLAAATARIGVATADLFPKFSLTGSLGTQSARFNNIVDWGSRYWSVGPSVSWPIFDAGRIRANIGVQNARQEEALATYQKTVLTSLQNVEDALVAYDREQVRRQRLAESVDANRRAADLANQRLNVGVADTLSVLDAERSLYAAQDQLIQSERDVSADLVALYKALGGGWEAPDNTK